jgi:hypothetical protein
MIKLLDILRESKESILVPRRSKEDREKNYLIAIQKRIKQYIANGSKGDLNLSNTPITSLPQDLQVKGNLYLRNTPITSLPQGLKVGGSLYLSNTPITSLPQNLKVGGNLNLYKTPITSLPQGLEVGEDLDLDDTPLSKKYTKEQIKQICPGIKGKVHF